MQLIQQFFLLLGLEEDDVTLGLTLLLVAVAIGAVLLGRAVTIYGLGTLLSMVS